MELAKKLEMAQFESAKIGYSYIKGLKSGHYSLATAIAELFDNSEDAGATKMFFQTEGASKNVTELVIADNGKGMTYEELQGSFTLGLNRERSDKELGKFGFGGTVSMFSIAGTKITLTRGRNGCFARKYDMRDIKQNDSWGTTSLRWESWMDDYLNRFLSKGETGTVIILRNLENTFSKSKSNICKSISNHCAIVFGEKINNAEIQFEINGDLVEGYDPLHWYSGARQVVSEALEVNGSKVIVRLADLTDVPSREMHSSWKNREHASGGYIYRNNRLIKGRITRLADGSFSQFFQRHAHYRNVRWAIYFDGSVDDVMKVSFDKTNINPDHSFLDAVASKIMPDAKAIRIATEKGKKETDEDLKQVEEAADQLLQDLSRKTYDAEWTSDGSSGAEPSNPELKIVEVDDKDLVADDKTSVKVPNIKTVEERFGPLSEPYMMISNPDQTESKWLLKLNLDHRFISVFWTNGTKEHRDVIKATSIATCLANLEIPEENSVDIYDYRNKVSRHLLKVTPTIVQR